MIGLFVGFELGGILGAIVVIALSDVPAYLAIQYGLYQEGISCLFEDMKSSLILLLVLGFVFLMRSFLGMGLPFDSLPAFSG